MRNVKNSIPVPATAVIVAACLVVSAAAEPQTPAVPDCRWQSSFSEHLGIEPASTPADGQQVQMLKAVVTDPDRLYSMGLVAAGQGDRISMLCIDSDVWRIKHTATGLTITFSTRPF